ncbi:Calmodulin-sensitive adenylate cyclase precursor [Rubripirellula lacrimiformis]|uniref:Calmodulin-sensitive adenylate cyclase n=1 Tax=Rubripirellula lacrimiformis TaxID=1930273 RepID=A0A517NFS9_9BACT|nr:anthrax toxin-like adenylyl cyclase domain-containing protein [Rubripirellula lacrimiformis]QDT05974.1 Calmodulin-sensitive adenylate cyclase precursor [Rubripirellula lacrimiformis]
MIENTFTASQRSGMPLSHAGCFQQIANALNCMIASRSVGIYATGLILENYASKGFQVKTKSCNWGPMAGFVLSDPRFSKNGAKAVVSQRQSTHKALSHGAGEMPVYITDRRRQELESLGCMNRIGGNINAMVYSAHPRDSRNTMQFVLQRKISGVPGSNGLHMWAVCYDRNQTAMPSSPTARSSAGNDGALLPVMALVDPDCPAGVRGTYRSAMTGDYDLWGIWPAASDYKPRGLDRRPVPESERRPLSYKTFAKHEDANLGNITGRGIQVKDRLNAAIRAAGYTGGNMVHHSDETGRPQVFEVEMEFIAFIPGQDGQARFVETMTDFRVLMKQCVADYSISLNGAWQRALGFGASVGGSYEWP